MLVDNCIANERVQRAIRAVRCVAESGRRSILQLQERIGSFPSLILPPQREAQGREGRSQTGTQYGEIVHIFWHAISVDDHRRPH